MKARIKETVAPARQNTSVKATPLSGYIDTKELAESLGVHPTTLIKWRAARRGPPFTRLGQRVLYNVDKFRVWLDQQERRSIR